MKRIDKILQVSNQLYKLKDLEGICIACYETTTTPTILAWRSSDNDTISNTGSISMTYSNEELSIVNQGDFYTALEVLKIKNTVSKWLEGEVQ